jgi:hypothetical protein
MTIRRKDTQKEQLWQWLANRTGLEAIDDNLQAKLDKSGWMQDWESAISEVDRTEFREYLLAELRKDLELLKAYGVVGSNEDHPIVRRRGTTRTLTLTSEGALAARAEAMCLYWAKLAEASREVREFRTNTLGGAAVSSTEARNLIHSPAAAVFTPEDLRAKNVPILGHTSEILRYEASKPFEQPYWAHVTVKVTWLSGVQILKRSRKSTNPTEVVTFWDGEDVLSVAPWRHSVLWKLHDLAVKVSRTYPWEVPAAAWLVLTAQPPRVAPVSAEIRELDYTLNHGTITITAAKCVPAEVISRFYAKLKADLGSTLTPSDRRLALFRFVVERSSGITELDTKQAVLTTRFNIPSWRSLLSQWNELHPPDHEWHYKGVQNFHRDFKEASEALLGHGSEAS